MSVALKDPEIREWVGGMFGKHLPIEKDRQTLQGTRELISHLFGKGKSSTQKCFGKGYFSSQEGTSLMAGEGFEIALLVGRKVKTQQNQQIL